MPSPDLKRAVWLTENQRQRLAKAATKAAKHPASQTEHCEAILKELAEADAREISTSRLIYTFVTCLQMPSDTLPVYVCDIEVEQVIAFSDMDAALARVLLNRKPHHRRSQK